MNAGVCRSCGANILWVKTAAGKIAPLDDQPSIHGNIVIAQDGLAHYVKGNDFFNRVEPKYLSHFATCPNAASHRKKAEG